MHILIVGATEQELLGLSRGRRGAHHVEVLVTGIGMVATAASVAQALTRAPYDVAFNFGVCGAFDRSLPLGSVVHVTSERLAELGAEDGDEFVSMPSLGLHVDEVIENDAPPDNPVLRKLPAVRGITVNTVHGRESSIAAVTQRFAPHVESMEGGAFAYACRLCGIQYAQVRAVSNIVERRNRDAWRLDVAIRQLTETALRILDCA